MQFQASTFCDSLLRTLNLGDPYASESITRAKARMNELLAPMEDLVSESPDGRTIEDVVNYLGAEILALIVVTADLVCDPREFVDTLSEQVNGLVMEAQA